MDTVIRINCIIGSLTYFEIFKRIFLKNSIVFNLQDNCSGKLMPSSVVEARYNLNILSCRSSYNLKMLITTISVEAKCEKRTTRRKKIAEISVKLHGK